MPNSAIILAAGFGARMRPITESIPKPLVKIAGKSLIDYSIEMVREAGIDNIVVNSHYLASQIHAHLSDSNIKISHEEAILDTGGGVKNARHFLGDDPFFVINSDQIFLYKKNPLLVMMENFHPHMDGLMLVSTPSDTIGYDGDGDLTLDEDKRVRKLTHNNMIYTGIQLIQPNILNIITEQVFSFSKLFFDEKVRYYGHKFEGRFLHIGTPISIAIAQEIIENEK